MGACEMHGGTLRELRIYAEQLPHEKIKNPSQKGVDFCDKEELTLLWPSEMIELFLDVCGGLSGILVPSCQQGWALCDPAVCQGRHQGRSC